jgi:hypothetical protein
LVHPSLPLAPSIIWSPWFGPMPLSVVPPLPVEPPPVPVCLLCLRFGSRSPSDLLNTLWNQTQNVHGGQSKISTSSQCFKPILCITSCC